MSNAMQSKIGQRMEQKSNDELTAIWIKNDRSELSEDAFVVIKNILTSRGVQLPAQEMWPRPKPIPMPESAAVKEKPKYTWFYVGAVFIALGCGSLSGLTIWAPATRCAIIAIALAYCLILPRYLKLSVALGITFFLEIIVFLGVITVTKFIKASVNANLALVALALNFAARVFYVAVGIMFGGITFHGIALGLRKVKKKRTANN